MANPICLSPLKFYDSVDKQNHRKSYAYGHIVPLIMPFNTLDSFQLVIKGTNITSAILYNASGSQVSNIYTKLVESGLSTLKIDSYNVTIFPGIYQLTDNVKYEGEYYLKLGDNAGNYYYSEIFCFTNNVDDCLTIEYWNPESDFSLKGGVITFAKNFHFIIRLKTELGKPEYKFEEEATKRLGYSFVESQVSSKVYKFNAVLPEYLCDALRIIRLCSNKILTSRGEEFEMLSFDMSVEWQEQGDLASVDCEFEVDNILVNFGGYSYEKVGGDFNDDFNEDFNNR